MTKRFSEERMAIITQAVAILEEYAAQGFDLTLRQIYYQFVARDLFPNGKAWIDEKTGSKNCQKNYSKLGDILNDARLAGLVDWTHMVDRTRSLKGIGATRATWTGPDDIIRAAASGYLIDKWGTQSHRPEVWVEKEAVAGIAQVVCAELAVPYLACKGYMSASEMWVAARRMQRWLGDAQTPIIFHIGDHDPSGIQMTADIRARLNETFGTEVEVRRIALNMDQVEQYNPPPNPAKETDSRFTSYADEFGDECWELDALSPTVLSDLIRDAVTSVRDEEEWNEALEREATEKASLQRCSDHWSEVELWLDEQHPAEEGE